jgi:hypothetical protein
MGHAGLKASDDEQTGSPRTLGEQLLKGLTEFRGNRHQGDETLLVLQRERESVPTLA